MAADSAGRAVWVAAGMVCLAALLTWVRLAEVLPPGLWRQAAFAPVLDDPSQLVFHFSTLPRLATALLCGAGLGLAGALFQHVLRNPLASPTTLGIEAGSQLAVTVATIWAPAFLAGGREIVSLGGAALATVAVFSVSAAQGLTSLSLILTGLVVGLFCGALSAALKLLNQEYASALFLWGGGSLVQEDWSAPAFLWPRLAILALAAALVARPLALLSLGDGPARALGLPVGVARAGGLAIGVLLTSTVTATVGAIGFVGLAAPQIAELAGARRLGARLALAAVIGAALVTAVDACVGALADRVVFPVPTGAATALFGAPLLVWLLPRVRLAAAPRLEAGRVTMRRAGASPLVWLAAAATVLLVGAILFGRTSTGWTLPDLRDWPVVAPWRAPRAVAALGAGIMLAVAGCLLQRLTGNAMASPEMLGLGTGVAAGLAAALLLVPALGAPAQLAASALGAFAALVVLLAVGSRSRFAPDQMLLTGIALSALLDALVVSFLALGDARALQLLGFMSGSTYRADAASAVVIAVVAALLVPVALALRRPLDILPLGEASARAYGLPLPAIRLSVMGLAAGLTAAAMLAVGPLSFVGLMSPHAARLLGFRRAAPQILAACLIGGAIMVAADWIGRNAIYPRQIPAGLVAALIGTPYLVWQLGRRHT